MEFLFHKLNFPLYLYKILSKISCTYQSRRKNSKRSLFPHNFIYILFRHHLEKTGDEYDHFLDQNGFEEPQLTNCFNSSDIDAQNPLLGDLIQLPHCHSA